MVSPHGMFQELLHLAVASSTFQGSASCHRTSQFAKHLVSPLSSVDYLVERSQQISAASLTLASLYQREITGMNKWQCLFTQPFWQEVGEQLPEHHAKIGTERG